MLPRLARHAVADMLPLILLMSTSLPLTMPRCYYTDMALQQRHAADS